MSGPPGAGKSTVAQALVGLFGQSALVAGDAFFDFLRGGYLPPWTGPAHRQNEVVIGAAAAAAGRLVAGGYTVVYDGVIGPWFLATFAAATGLGHLHYAMLLPTEQECVERVSARVGHGFTDIYATRQLYREFADAPVDRRHVVSAGQSAEAVAASVAARVRDGSLIRAIGPAPGAP